MFSSTNIETLELINVKCETEEAIKIPVYCNLMTFIVLT